MLLRNGESPVHSLCKFDEVTTVEVERLLNDSSTKQCELDSASVWLLKSLCMVFAPILALLIKVSIQDAILPQSQKRSILIGLPVLKREGLDATDPSNYRPIANVTFLSKIIERVAASQLIAYLEVNKLLPVCQSGFQKGHSTETLLLPPPL